jgi:glycosyltransferase involved in cell wall biosynthesis
MKLTVIFSTFNEMKLPFLEKSLKLLSEFDNIDIICVDYNSCDSTCELATRFGAQVIRSQENSRAKRLNQGISQATGEYILLHHPRSLLSRDGIEYLLTKGPNFAWGGFTHQFDKQRFIYQFTSWYSNEVRSKIRNIVYLDHCIFVQRDLLLKVGGVPELDIFEDTALSEKLSKITQAKILPFPATTSSIRFEKNGKYRQALLNQLLKIGYNIGLNDQQMNRIYELGLSLNSKY